MRIKVIKNEKEHKEALKAIESLWSAKAGTAEGDTLEVLAALVEAFEEKKYSILPPDPVEAIRFRMEQDGLDNADLAKVIGGKNRASEVMRHKRGLSLEMIRNLHKKFHIPAESLIAA